MVSKTELIDLTPQQAWEMMEENPRAVLIDVRSNAEFLFVGHPKGAVHIPWMDEPDWEINPHFVAEVRKLMLGGTACHEPGCAPIILICRSGNRSEDAGNLLIEEGLPEVYHIAEGFEGPLDEKHQRSTISGWRYHGLPWEQC